MDALLMLNQSNSIDESRFVKSRDMARKVEANASKFNNEIEEAVSADKTDSIKKGEKKIDEKVMGVCLEFESIFVNMMLKQMRQTVHKGDILNGGQSEEIFTDMLYDQYSLSVSKNANLGIAKQMYTQMAGASVK